MTKHGIEVLAFIREFRNTHQYGPTVREICKSIGWKSPSTAHKALEVLEYEGMISRVKDIPRTIALTEKGVETLEAKHGAASWSFV